MQDDIFADFGKKVRDARSNLLRAFPFGQRQP